MTAASGWFECVRRSGEAERSDLADATTTRREAAHALSSSARPTMVLAFLTDFLPLFCEAEGGGDAGASVRCMRAGGKGWGAGMDRRGTHGVRDLVLDAAVVRVDDLDDLSLGVLGLGLARRDGRWRVSAAGAHGGGSLDASARVRRPGEAGPEHSEGKLTSGLFSPCRGTKRAEAG